MKIQSLLKLSVLLVVLISITYYTKKKTDPNNDTTIAPGDVLLPSLDVNNVRGILIMEDENTISVSRKEGTWMVDSLHNYPADFSVIKENLRKIADLKAGQIMRAGDNMLGEFGLSIEDTADIKPTTILLKDKTDQVIGSLLLGAPRQSAQDNQYGGYPDGHYLRVSDGPVILVDENLSQFPKKNESWIQKLLLEVNAEEITEINVTQEDASFKLKVLGPNQYKIEDLELDQELVPSQASKLARSIQHLSCLSIADPALGDEELGMTQPSQTSFKTKEGIIYTASLGANTQDNNRYVRLSVGYVKPKAPSREDIEKTFPYEEETTPTVDEAPQDDTNQEQLPIKTRDEKIDEAYNNQLSTFESTAAKNNDKAIETHQKLNAWTYILSSYNADSLSISKKDMVQTKEPEPAEETNSPEALNTSSF